MSLLSIIISVMEEKKGNDIKVIDFKNTNSLCDAFVICDAPSLRQVQAIAEAISEKLEESGYEIKNPERNPQTGWILIDAKDVVVHVFQTEQRAHYNLEKLYKEYLR